jgi:hypothetical protein
MMMFVESSGKINVNPNLTVKKIIQPELAINDALLQTRDINTLTAKERNRILKEQKAREEFEMMKKAAEEAHIKN